jgi:hypothetical protein
VISDEKLIDHWRATLRTPPLDVRVIGRVTVPFGVPDPEAIEMVSLWPNAMAFKPNTVSVINRWHGTLL